MCDRESGSVKTAGLPASVSEAYPGGRRLPALESESGSRRRRLWELPTETHCPVIGVCLPITVLRKLIGKALGAQPIADDYEFHVAAVAECARRRPISELLQRELDRRYAVALRRFAHAKTTPALHAMWEDAVHESTVAEALWAMLSHARCDEALRQKVCRDIHMFQHQAGASARADLQRLAALHDQNLALARELASLKERLSHDLQQRDVEIGTLNAQLTQVRGRLIAREADSTQLRAQLVALEDAVPSLPARIDLLQRVEQQHRQLLQLERDCAYWRRHAQQVEERARVLATQFDTRCEHATHATAEPAGTALRDKAVLCVGGRPASVPVYRRMVEGTGGRFLHHDGGEENCSAQLEAGLAAADLVICQTGCVSHGAYWRVKDHCKRTGKRCVFVEKPSASSLARCLRGLADADSAVDGPGSLASHHAAGQTMG